MNKSKSSGSTFLITQPLNQAARNPQLIQMIRCLKNHLQSCYNFLLGQTLRNISKWFIPTPCFASSQSNYMAILKDGDFY